MAECNQSATYGKTIAICTQYKYGYKHDIDMPSVSSSLQINTRPDYSEIFTTITFNFDQIETRRTLTMN